MIGSQLGVYTPEEAHEALSNIHLVSGSAHPELAQETAEYLGMQLGRMTFKQFDDGEQYVRYEDDVEGKHVVVMQSHVNRPGFGLDQALWQTALMTQAAHLSKAKKVTVFMPKPAYDRGDRQVLPGEAVPARAVFQTLSGVKASSLVVVDIHSETTLDSFNGPSRPISAQKLLFDELGKRVDGNNDKFIVVGADKGSDILSQNAARYLNLDLTEYVPKKRDENDPSIIERPKTIEGVEGRVCLLVDDVIATGRTIGTAVRTFRKSKARGVIVAATHALCVGGARDHLKSPFIREVIVTNSVPLDQARNVVGNNRLTAVSLAPLLGREVLAIATGGLVSGIVEEQSPSLVRAAPMFLGTR